MSHRERGVRRKSMGEENPFRNLNGLRRKRGKTTRRRTATVVVGGREIREKEMSKRGKRVERWWKKEMSDGERGGEGTELLFPPQGKTGKSEMMDGLGRCVRYININIHNVSQI